MDSDSIILSARYLVLIIALAMSMYFDLKEHKIKNFITVPAALLGLSINFYEYGIKGLVASGKGLFIPIALLMVFYLINVMGAGDIKLFAAVGSIMGLPFAIDSIILSICFGALFSVLLLLRLRQFREKLKNIFCYFVTCCISRRLVLYAERGNNDSKFPFSAAIMPAVLTQIFITGFDMRVY